MSTIADQINQSTELGGVDIHATEPTTFHSTGPVMGTPVLATFIASMVGSAAATAVAAAETANG